MLIGGLDNCVKLWDTSRLSEERDKIGQEWYVLSSHFVLLLLVLLSISLLGSYPTKSTAIHCLQFTRKNLLMAAGPYLK